MATIQKRSYCRICCAHCGVILSIDEDRQQIVGIKPDKDSPLSQGHICFKGLQAGEAHHGPRRLLRPLKRQSDGSHVEIDGEQALDEVAEKMRAIIDRGGGDAVATFKGTQGTLFATNRLQISFLEAIGSSQYFSTHTIDQSAKSVSFERQGGWNAGLQDLSQSEVLLFFGTNPLVSHSTMPVMSPDPARMLKKARARGLKLICVDPRRTETAYHSDLFLQPLPGRDAPILAAMLRLILAEGWEDGDFVARHVGAERLAELAAAVAPFTTELVERHAGLEAGQIRAATEMFARDCRTGAAYAATGTTMSAFSNLAQHLVDTLNIVCGRYRRAGDTAVVDMVSPRREFFAEVIPPPRSWEAVPASRIRGVGRLGMDRLASTLADEILTPGPGRIRSLVVHGANPAVCLPDRRKVLEAFRDLELLVVVDPYMSATAKLAHYVFPPTMMYERSDLPYTSASFPIYPMTWTQFTPAVLPRPEGSDLIEDWYFYWAVAKRLGRQLTFFGTKLDFERTPTTEELLALRLRDTPVTVDELKRDRETHPAGKLYDPPGAIVRPARPDANGRFHPMPEDVAAEVSQLLSTMTAAGASPAFPHLLTTRRLGSVMNSTGGMLSATLKRMPHNAAYMSPDELTALNLAPGDTIEIASEHGRIEATVEPDAALRGGIVSIAHCWGDVEGAGLPGANVNELIACDRDLQPINAMPRMSAVPVRITRSAEVGAKAPVRE
jgi:anaerobic selenocysteine-containing dehydrogenase